MVAEAPKSPRYRSRLAGSLRRRGLLRRASGDLAGAAADTRRALAVCDGLSSRAGEDWFEAACCHAVLAGLAGRDGSGVSADEAVTEADRAMDLLRKAVDTDFRNVVGFRTETALDPLRDRDDFRLLIMDVAFPAAPFARPLSTETQLRPDNPGRGDR